MKPIIWLIILVLFGIGEAVTVGLTSIWFALGALGALIVSQLGLGFWPQIITFIVLSALSMLLVRPFAKKFLRPGYSPTNADRVLGETAKVTETIDNLAGTGAVYVDGKTWTARSADGSVLPAGSRVEIRRMEGVKLIVEAAQKAPDKKEEVV